jgi:hypothetical protein
MQWYQYSLGGFLIFTGLCAAVLGLIIAIPQEVVVDLAGFAYSFAVIMAAVVLASAVHALFHRMTALITIPVILVGYFFLIFAFCLVSGMIDRSCLPLPKADSLARCAEESVLWAVRLTTTVVILISLDAVMQLRQENEIKDFAYYPRVTGLVKSLSLVRCRLVLVAGFLILFGNYALIVVEVWRAGTPILPLDITFKTCVWGWAVLWIADCLCRPRRIAVWVAIAFLVYSLIALPPSQIVRE